MEIVWAQICIYIRRMVAGRQSTARRIHDVTAAARASFLRELTRGGTVGEATGHAIHDAHAALARLTTP